jgi:hypothetical protein
MNPYHDTTKVGSNGFNTADTHGRNGFNDGPRAASAVSDNFVTVDLNADAKDVADNGHEGMPPILASYKMTTADSSRRRSCS